MALNDLENRGYECWQQSIPESVQLILDWLSNEQKREMFKLLEKEFSMETFRDPEYDYDSESNNFWSIHFWMDEEEYEEYYNDDSDGKREYEEFWKEPLPERLSEYRSLREQRIRWVSPESKEKIKNAAENIKCEVELYDNWARRVHLKFWKHWCTDLYFTEYLLDSEKVLGEYMEKEPDSITWGESINVNLAWIEWPDPDNWEDYKVRNYYQRRTMPTNEWMRSVLNILWNYAGLHEERDQIALMMYLTGMEWKYWLAEGESVDLLSFSSEEGKRLHLREDHRTYIACDSFARGFWDYFYEDGNSLLNAKLFSIDWLLWK